MISSHTVQSSLAIEWKGSLDEMKKRVEIHSERMRVYKDLQIAEAEEGGETVDILAKDAGLLKRMFSHWFRAVMVLVDARLQHDYRRLLTIVRLNTVHEDDQAPGLKGSEVCMRTIFEWWSLIAQSRKQKPERFRTIRATFVSTSIHAMLGIPAMSDVSPEEHHRMALQRAAEIYDGSARHLQNLHRLQACESDGTLKTMESIGESSSASTYHGIHSADWKPAGCRPLSRMRGLNAMLNDKCPPEFAPIPGKRRDYPLAGKRPLSSLPGLPELNPEQLQGKIDHWSSTLAIHKELERSRRHERSSRSKKRPPGLAALRPPSTKALRSATANPRYVAQAASLRAAKVDQTRSPRSVVDAAPPVERRS